MKWSERLAQSIALADSLPQELRDNASIICYGAVLIAKFREGMDRIACDFIAQNYPDSTISVVHDYDDWANCAAVLNGVELKWSKRVAIRIEDHE